MAHAKAEVASGRSGGVRWWRVRRDRVELELCGDSWTARVARSDWGGDALLVDRFFEDESEALLWGEGVAATFARDLDDDSADDRPGIASGGMSWHN